MWLLSNVASYHRLFLDSCGTLLVWNLAGVEPCWCGTLLVWNLAPLIPDLFLHSHRVLTGRDASDMTKSSLIALFSVGMSQFLMFALGFGWKRVLNECTVSSYASTATPTSSIPGWMVDCTQKCILIKLHEGGSVTAFPWKRQNTPPPHTHTLRKLSTLPRHSTHLSKVQPFQIQNTLFTSLVYCRTSPASHTPNKGLIDWHQMMANGRSLTCLSWFFLNEQPHDSHWWRWQLHLLSFIQVVVSAVETVVSNGRKLY